MNGVDSLILLKTLPRSEDGKPPAAAHPSMVHAPSRTLAFTLVLSSVVLLCAIVNGCEKKSDPAAEAPPAAQVIAAPSASLVKVDHPDQFPLATAVAYQATSSLNVTGVVNPDVSNTIPVISLASGRVVALHVKVGDFVKKGELLMEVASDDISAAYSTYHKAVADEVLARVQLERAKLLFDKGAIPKSQLEIAQDTEDKAVIDVQTALEHLRLLGVKNPNGPQVQTVNIYSPATGVIIQQNVTPAAPAVNALSNSPTPTSITSLSSSTNLFTIADLSHVWVVCDVYENDLSQVHTGQIADIRLNAYPDRVLQGRISEIDAVLDPNIRTGKVRIQVENPGYFMRIGMFATATFHGKQLETHAAVPSAAVLHLHDRAWVYVPDGSSPGDAGQYRRLAVTTGASLPDGMLEIVSGVNPGQKVVSNALELQDTVEQ
jgi:cobalt-zinc-cadmium efflux system membrane fusion protein